MILSQYWVLSIQLGSGAAELLVTFDWVEVISQPAGSGRNRISQAMAIPDVHLHRAWRWDEAPDVVSTSEPLLSSPRLPLGFGFGGSNVGSHHLRITERPRCSSRHHYYRDKYLLEDKPRLPAASRAVLFINSDLLLVGC